MAIADHFSDRVAELSQTRAGCAIGGAALLAWGLLARGKPMARGLSSLAGAGLLYHAWTGRIPFAQSVATAGTTFEPLLVSDSVRVNTGRDTTYRYWRNLYNLASFMTRVESVEELNERRSRWQVRTADGQSVAFISEIVDDDPGKAIYWRTVDSPIQHEGVVRFQDCAPEWGTIVSVEMRYMLPTGARGELARQALGDPQRDLSEDLQRFKQTIESEDFLMTAPQS